jgi:hypothetical protein
MICHECNSEDHNNIYEQLTPADNESTSYEESEEDSEE